MNPIFRFIYWEMNYHVEHHMFPMVPYHALGKLHQELKADMPKPYYSLWEAYREIIPTLIRERKDPTYFVHRELPSTAQPVSSLEPV
jgi:fatty acid desaturase